MEVRHARWQRWLGSVLLGIMAAAGFFTAATSPLDQALVGGIVGLFATYWLIFLFRYRLLADDSGIEQRHALVTKRVRWADVAFFRPEARRFVRAGHQAHEPVLYSEDAHELLRPVAPLLLNAPAQVDERERFWAYVRARLPGKERP